MDEIRIRNEQYEICLKEFEKAYEQLRTKCSLSKFQTKESFLLVFNRDHKVTGAEMNTFVTEVQRWLSYFAKNDKENLDRFLEVFKMFDVSQREYIEGIVNSVEQIRKLSDDVNAKEELHDKLIEALLEKIVKNRRELDEINAQQDAEISKQIKINEAQEEALEQQRQKDEMHDRELGRQAQKDAEHDVQIKAIYGFNNTLKTELKRLKWKHSKRIRH